MFLMSAMISPLFTRKKGLGVFGFRAAGIQGTIVISLGFFMVFNKSY
jgi:hypothetical protein